MGRGESCRSRIWLRERREGDELEGRGSPRLLGEGGVLMPKGFCQCFFTRMLVAG